MTVQRLGREDVAASALGILGLDETAVDLLSIEGLCASLRRAASFLCPVSPRQIVDTVMNALGPIVEGLERDDVTEALDALVMSGDLLELRPAEGGTRLLFLGPPSFVEKHEGEYLLLGIRPRAAALLDLMAIDAEVIYDAHTRSLLLEPASAIDLLTQAGLQRLTREHWTKAPRNETTERVIEVVRDQLSRDRAPGAISELSIIDPARPVHYYKGRWREPKDDDTGIFVGRRPQAYGAPIWCVVEIEGGVPQAVLDLPVDSSVAPGWDEARRIQAALDAETGAPQIYRTRPAGPVGGETAFDFFGPLPTWAERYLAISGRPVTKGPRSLFAYSLPAAAVDDAHRFLSSSLWMTSIKEDQEP